LVKKEFQLLGCSPNPRQLTIIYTFSPSSEIWLTQLVVGHCSPFAIFIDFEEAMRQAAMRCFPEAKVYGEYFHFMQANLRWVAQNIGVDLREKVAGSLRNLAASPDATTFQLRLGGFIKYWVQTCPRYAEYFNAIWCKKWPPRLWAALGRKGLQEIPSGDHALEGWHNRLQHHT